MKIEELVLGIEKFDLVFLQDSSGAEFFVRVGNTTKPLDSEATHAYIKMHWET